MEKLNAGYWTGRYADADVPWDLGKASRPLVEFSKTLDKQSRILIPGGGAGHEWKYLTQQGFENVCLLDWSGAAFRSLAEEYPEAAGNKLIQGDFFAHNGVYDAILEQTFFCALPPAQRGDYAAKTADLLVKGGSLAGVWFDFPLTEKGPPFGGSAEEYSDWLSPYFSIRVLERCRNSEPERDGKEIFIWAQKK